VLDTWDPAQYSKFQRQREQPFFDLLALVRPAPTLADVVASEEPFRAAFGGWRRPQPVLEPADYARILVRNGVAEPQVRLMIYPHVLPGREDVVEWIRGTLSTEYEKRLSPEQVFEFLESYRARLLQALERERPFFFPFQRILCWGQKPIGGPIPC
jgi:trans-aconitate 2-methyltransferase